jgi:hypothetical protein
VDSYWPASIFAAKLAAFREIGLKSVGTIMFIFVGIFVTLQKK